MFTANRDAHRRGVILLVVLALLAMFGLAGLGFLVITSANKRAAKTLHKVDQQAFSPREDTNRAVLQVVRGSAHADSVIGPHSLVEDLYGNDSVAGEVFDLFDSTVVGAPWTIANATRWDAMKPRLLAGGQIFEFVIRDNNPQRYVGRAITFTTGPCTGVTSRVVGVRQVHGDMQGTGLDILFFWVDAFDAFFRFPTDPEFPGRPIWKIQVETKGLLPLGPDGAPGVAGIDDDGVGGIDDNNEFFHFPPIAANDDLDLGDQFIINGAPFSGAGMGLPDLAGGAVLDPNALLDAGYDVVPPVSPSPLPYALLPNSTVENYHNNGPISANEEYDAVDYQNMLMAMVLADGTVPSPTLHRPALVNYWAQLFAADTVARPEAIPVLRAIDSTMVLEGLTPVDRAQVFLEPYSAASVALGITTTIADSIVQFKRGFILRPLSDDHPDFDGGNPGFDLSLATLVTGPWDVDNDGDGQPDSIWVDLGLPVRQMPDGRKYKPMFAILCTDLDGRLNINAHGCAEQLRTTEYYGSVLDPLNDAAGNPRIYADLPLAAAAPMNVPPLPRGQGYGPAEINLSPLFTLAPVQYANLLLGATLANGDVNGRYGEVQWMVAPPRYDLPSPGRSYNPSPTMFDDPLSYNWIFGYAADYYNSVINPAGVRTEYGTPADLKGTMTAGLDLRGQPIVDVTQSVPAGFSNGWNVNAWGNAGTNDPYELDLTKCFCGGDLNLPASEDDPFTVAEFERVWRPYDTDTASLPDRLVNLAPLLNPQAGEAEFRRHKTTPASWDLPCPAAATPVDLLEDFRDQLFVTDFPLGLPFPAPVTTPQVKENDVYRWAISLFPPRSPHDILAARMYHKLRNDGVNDGNIPLDASNARDAIEASLPILTSSDLLAGLKMDLNRRLGNGVDDVTVDTNADGIPDVANGVVDEASERFALGQYGVLNADPTMVEQMTLADGTGGTVTVAFDHDNDGDVTPGEHLQPLSVFVGPTSPPAVPGDIDSQYSDYAYRHAYARHLYVLMMALTDPDWYPPGTPPAPPYPSPQHDAARAKGIAQWAVNVVDFRDRDATMTPFEYDIYPFVDATGDTNTWDVDGRIQPARFGPIPPGDSWTSPDDSAAYRGLVWGCERPELLITETMAVHDRRTEDLNTDPNGQDTAGGDTDFDQRYRPQGSLFVELFNPQSPTDAPPGEFYYDRAAGAWQGGVVLNQGTITSNHPVWRMVIVPVDPANLVNDQIADPDDPSAGVVIERSIYFRDMSAIPGWVDGTRFYTAAAMAPILNNRYAVVGPGDPDRTVPATAVTKVGFRNPGPPLVTQGRRIELTPNVNPNVAQVLIDGEDNGIDDLARPEPVPYPPGAGVPPRTQNAIQPTVAVIVDQPRRLSVTEPIAGYVPAGAYDVNSAGHLHAPPPIDIPQDISANEYWTGVLDTDATHAKFRILHLQRLADPLQDYDSQTNPYRTVDSAQIDLTAFNGVTGPAVDPILAAPGTYAFFTRERGETTPPLANNLWQVTITNNATAPSNDHGEGANSRYIRTVANPHFFGEDFSHTLGYVNECFGDPRKPDDLNAGTTDDVPDAPGYMGDPTAWAGDTPRPFPWLTWHNRPFTGQLELPLVPASSSSRMLVNYSMSTGGNTYEDGAGTFTHLLNFFNSDETAAVPPDPPPAHFYRLLEFVHVPSRFVGAQNQLNPDMAVGDAHVHHPPFQWISRYREPGRINLNTMYVFNPLFNGDVYTGLMNSQPGLSTLATATLFDDSRRGYAGANFGLDPTYPTRFANPFRSFCGLERVPMASLSTPIGQLGGLGTGSGQGVNATMLRADPVGVPAPRDPLWEYDPAAPPLWFDCYDSDRNPYFRYQGMQRLGNLTTSRSNVYAVWITVGYFEVEKVEPGAGGTVDRKVYLEGYTLGRELGGDTGEVERHRAFYVIDRSIPVGFQRGKDLNAEKTIVLKRFIE